MSDDETFTRLLYFGTVLMGMSEERFWFTPIGAFLDLWACHKQWLGLEKTGRGGGISIDDVVPM